LFFFLSKHILKIKIDKDYLKGWTIGYLKGGWAITKIRARPKRQQYSCKDENKFAHSTVDGNE